ncbi:hypothetical protein NDU88_005908 [Pleurodeles waltl]|uniref:Uncharacterized protein n=1 Tax=Pleurodeles waltl TaxID=8319 RepID=A0AAV7UJE1_PLEWA|nr:hypothetical protein NDU88_005908 [Pleurodeles waltl]
MGHDRPPHIKTAQTKMDQYTTVMGGGIADRRPQDVAGSPPPTDVGVLLKAIQDRRKEVESKVDGIQVDLSLVRQDLQRVVERVTEAETRISTTEEDVTTPQK